MCAHRPLNGRAELECTMSSFPAANADVDETALYASRCFSLLKRLILRWQLVRRALASQSARRPSDPCPVPLRSEGRRSDCPVPSTHISRILVKYLCILLQKCATVDDVFNGGIRSLSLSLLTEGSYSDSGISDEGSEQELSEREHRLAAIRRLVRQLEAIMAPDSEARTKMTERLEQAEAELRKLQSQCRGLIVRTAVCAEVQSRSGAHSSSLPG